ncbi:putative bifunctional diguanylate cyclase/phosphodiesterase [Rhodospirillum rubrum]|uniref:Response regulator receiver modulated diguanylate cyclase/phosphodiesterase n=1 Tax=Rhodospirillum rubrum (strain ATCC 11170 / ATH 1.1.1 / DSM 467 / LMG 4362 / NCIMB 8255 / S1) TaxID=269796 RepID=Q2RWN2_RHORT|nr:EAL domain-containing protein [Rhodospirillum rubrum]ABC21463.1 response regulator receiver modulated diguanylate cyclase/phosphodiesterase [Rhodospirillum rubrum ATCC 11170]AEO47145.1 response regulator receiver modulated diguanylate cyclase/phosphodiesterase [Rhodospirillum rubrum F11]MBK5953057.1 diguanylate cyclase [Rhodospirillum rubrum]QXG81138.1 EAL domain-containing protein [Rhodospirillum rubrum]HAP99205.1 diguanylate cyclase [Rhodospirillum rubrum]
MTPNEDLIEIFEDEEISPSLTAKTWPILIVDDDQDVHDVSRLALRGVRLLDYDLETLHAYSAAQARAILSSRSDIAVALLDVVMEREDAGLDLVRWIRSDPARDLLRIVLRTGQPGYAPEATVIQDYDINDYRTKSELNRGRLISILTTALRSYRQMAVIAASRDGLDKIVRASADLLASPSMAIFAEGVLTQLAGLLGTERSGIVLARRNRRPGATASMAMTGDEGFVLAAAGPLSADIGRPLSDIGDHQTAEILRRTLESRRSSFDHGSMALYIATPNGDSLAVLMEVAKTLGDTDRKLVEVFCVNMAAGFDTISLFEQISLQAFHDEATGLPNLAACQSLIDQYLQRRQPVAVTFFSLEGFSAISDTLGRVIGDRMIGLLANAFRHRLQERGEVFRVGQETLATVIGGPVDQVGPLADQLAGDFRAGLPLDSMTLPVSFSHGTSVSTSEHDTAQILVQRAGIAMQKARNIKRGGGLTYAVAMEEEIRAHIGVISKLGAGVVSEAFVAVFQPKIRLADRSCHGGEALVRWRDGDGTMIAPSLFIPAAETSGHIVDIGYSVFRQSCAMIRSLKVSQDDARIAVNLSVRQMREPDLIDKLVSIAAEEGVATTRLKLEITESIVIDDLTHTVSLLKALKDKGFLLALDDFGTGYSSLSYLRSLPIDTLKIDRSFVSGLAEQADMRKIVGLIIGLGHELGFDITAEGVETEEEARIVTEMGCFTAQGYLFSKPLSAEDFLVFARTHAGARQTSGGSLSAEGCIRARDA